MSFIDTETLNNASWRLKQAADSANAAADRLQDVVNRISVLTDYGYGNNVERLIKALERLEENMQNELLTKLINNNSK